MKQTPKNTIISIPFDVFLWYLAACSVVAIGLVYLNKAELVNASVISEHEEKKTITLPFYSKSQEKGEVLFSFNLISTRLFSGNLRILPDDCITEIKINNQLLPEFLFFNKNCDGLNGLNINVSPYIVQGTNLVEIKVENLNGPYSLTVKDLSFYEKYVVLLLFFASIFFIRFRVLWDLLVAKTKNTYDNHKLLLWGNVALLLIFGTTFILSLSVFDYSVSFWFLALELILIISINLYYLIYKKLMFGKEVFWFALAMGCVFTAYFLFLHHSLFSYDYNGHLEYIRYVIETGVVPEAQGGWSFYHHSLYYRLVSSFWTIFETGDGLDNFIFYKTVQLFSLILFLLYLFFSVKTIDLFFRVIMSNLNLKGDKMRLIYILVLGLFVTWPANSIFSVRVGNDLMFDLFYSITFYCILKWYWSEKTLFFFLTLIFTSLAIWSKTNGFLLYGILGCLLLFKFVQDKKQGLKAKHVLHITLFTLFLSMGLYQSFHERFERLKVDSDTRLVVGNANGLGDDLVAENNAKNYLLFNPIKFVEIPFTDTRDESKGKSFFWFFLFKSSMFGEFSFDSPVLVFLARVLSALFLIFISMGLYGVIKSTKDLNIFTPFLVSALILVFSLMIFRIEYPFSSSNDFRYIFPAVIPLVIFIATTLITLSRFNRIFNFFVIVIGLFLISGIAFQILAIIRYAQN